MLALRVLRRRRRPDQSGHWPGGPGQRRGPGIGPRFAAQRIVAQLRGAGDQLVARRATDPPRHAGRGQGIPHAAGANRRPAGRLGADQRAPQRPRRKPPPRQPGRGHCRLAGRRGQHQRGREPGLCAGPERKKLGHAGRYGPLPGRRRRVPRRHTRLYVGRRGPERDAAGLQPLEALADETFLRRLSAAAARAIGRLQARLRPTISAA